LYDNKNNSTLSSRHDGSQEVPHTQSYKDHDHLFLLWVL